MVHRERGEPLERSLNLIVSIFYVLLQIRLANGLQVKTTSYILRKYRNSPPSFILHLHPTHFRLDDQDGIFLYNSPMKVLLEHVKEQTVPHDMVDHLLSSDIKFYGSTWLLPLMISYAKNHETISSSRSMTTEVT